MFVFNMFIYSVRLTWFRASCWLDFHSEKSSTNFVSENSIFNFVSGKKSIFNKKLYRKNPPTLIQHSWMLPRYKQKTSHLRWSTTSCNWLIVPKMTRFCNSIAMNVSSICSRLKSNGSVATVFFKSAPFSIKYQMPSEKEIGGRMMSIVEQNTSTILWRMSWQLSELNAFIRWRNTLNWLRTCILRVADIFLWFLSADSYLTRNCIHGDW